MDSVAVEPEGESRTSVDFDSTVLLDQPFSPVEEEIVIDPCKSVQFSHVSHESIYEKWIGKLEESATICVSWSKTTTCSLKKRCMCFLQIAEIRKEPSLGLGISLEGTVDVEEGKEVRPHHYIRNILPEGPVGVNGILQSGDELLEVIISTKIRSLK